MNKITDSEFKEKVLDAEGVVLLEFSAEWCGPCHMLEPVLDEIEAETDITVYKMDVDENEEVPAQHMVMSIPTMVVYVDGEPQGKMVGYRPKQNIIETIAGVTGIGIPT